MARTRMFSTSARHGVSGIACGATSNRGRATLRAFVGRLERELTDIETFVTHTDKEAALLENQLIKSHQPKYNVKLRDDKEYLSLRLDAKKPWPRLEVVRRPKPDGAQYFGPYHSATAARQTLRLVNRYFQVRTCTDTEFRLSGLGRVFSIRSSGARARACSRWTRRSTACTGRKRRAVSRRAARRAGPRHRRANERRIGRARVRTRRGVS